MGSEQSSTGSSQGSAQGSTANTGVKVLRFLNFKFKEICDGIEYILIKVVFYQSSQKKKKILKTNFSK